MSGGRIARTKIDPVALSRDTSRQRNWRHHYLITDETGEFDGRDWQRALGREGQIAPSAP